MSQSAAKNLGTNNHCLDGYFSPWRKPPEAAAYCQMSLSLFNQKRRLVPIDRIGGTAGAPRFHVDALDVWMVKLYEFETRPLKLVEPSESCPDIDQYPVKTNAKRHRPNLLE